MKKIISLIFVTGIILAILNFTNIIDSEADSSNFISNLQEVKKNEKTNFTSGRYNEVYFIESKQDHQDYLSLYFIWGKTKNKEKAIEDFEQLAQKLISEVDPSLAKQDIEQLLFDTLQFDQVVNEGHYNTTIGNNKYELLNKGYHLSLNIRVPK
jgi:hypothetical protein